MTQQLLQPIMQPLPQLPQPATNIPQPNQPSHNTKILGKFLKDYFIFFHYFF